MGSLTRSGTCESSVAIAPTMERPEGSRGTILGVPVVPEVRITTLPCRREAGALGAGRSASASSV
jgi:hypothetical protein